MKPFTLIVAWIEARRHYALWNVLSLYHNNNSSGLNVRGTGTVLKNSFKVSKQLMYSQSVSLSRVICKQVSLSLRSLNN